jgi:outer membrane protein OmpA-like peptidoglycan-associated protein
MLALRIIVPIVCLTVPSALTVAWVNAAAEEARAESEAEQGSEVAVASAANEEYCTRDLKRVLRRVLKSCGLLDSTGATARGCQPVTAKQVATMSGTDFNALFLPMKGRGGIVQFDQGSAELDDADRALVNKVFSSQAGASYFFVVSRASPEGSVERNRELSEARAEALMGHLRTTFQDPELEKEVGLLWLGEEFAQLDDTFCDWSRSGEEGQCTPADINRSAFVAWIDCRL